MVGEGAGEGGGEVLLVLVLVLVVDGGETIELQTVELGVEVDELAGWGGVMSVAASPDE